MGIVIKQSFRNTLILFLGFGIGGINVLFLYTRFLEAEYFGLITFLLSTANIIMPLLVFGMQHTIIKFFSSYKRKEEQDNFLLTALFLPLLIIIPFSILGASVYDYLSDLLSRENIIIKKYTYLIFFTAIFMGYFEVFYSWSRVHLKSVFGNFIKEVFARICVSFLLIGVYLGWLTNDEFVYAVVLVYFFRMLIMKIYAFSIYLPRLRWNGLPVNIKEIVSFSIYIILAGSAGTILLEIDKFMIPQLKNIAEVAYYSVGVYIASVIAIPSRAMQQIINPITAREINDENLKEVELLYKKSSLNLLVIGGLIFLLINTNIKELYMIIDRPEYSVGVAVVLVISLSELIKLSLGTNGAILTNSKYYKILFYYAIAMALSVIVLNRIFIDYMGIQGAAIATLIVVFVFSFLKIIYVYQKMKMQPFSRKTNRLLLLIALMFAGFYFIPTMIHPLLSILVKSLFISAIFIYAVFKMNISEDMNRLFKNRFGPRLTKN